MTRQWRVDPEVAAALADALLAGGWCRDALLARAAALLGDDPPWLSVLVDEVLVLFDQPPTSRPGELVDVVCYSETYQQAAAAARAAGRPLRDVRPILPRDPDRDSDLDVSLVLRSELPPITDLPRLATWLGVSSGRLAWLADPGGYQRRTRPGPLHLYDYHWSARPGRPPRLLEAPTPLLKRVQRQVLHQLLDLVPVHPAAHGFVPGRSVLSHARRHLGAEVVVTVDLVDFFAQITPGRLAGILRLAGCTDVVALALVGLCTTRTPSRVLTAMPPGGTGDQRYRLRSRLRVPHLPQGAPTSPALANLTCYHLDRRLTGYAATLAAEYSRYADDLTFSGDIRLRRAAAGFVRGVSRIVLDEGFDLSPAKTRVQTRGRRQVVAGLVVNERPNVDRGQHDRLRAVLHEARIRGPEVANREQHPDFRSHLTGRVAWVESVNPGRGRRLRRELEAISWTDRPG